MAWRILKVSQLPLGQRILCYGCTGSDVGLLQKILAESGFYFGEIDGVYGVLTEEAVILAERTFNLRVDGIAGVQVLYFLKHLSKKTGRNVYTVKDHENLEIISHKFGVTPNAWEALAGQGNPRRKVFPGMKLLLYEKAIFIWNKAKESGASYITGQIINGGMVNELGKLELEPQLPDNCYLLIEIGKSVWEALATSRKIRNQLLNDLLKVARYKFGFDLRNLASNLSGFWKCFLKEILISIRKKQISFLVRTIDLSRQFSNCRYFCPEWVDESKSAGWLMVEPELDLRPDFFEDAMQSYLRIIAKLNHLTMNRILPVVSTNGWEWKSNESREIPLEEAKLIRSINYRSVKYLGNIQFTKVEYLRRGEPYQVYYRDERGWLDYLRYIKKYHFPGLVIRNSEKLGANLSKFIANSFLVLPENKLKALQ